MVGGWATVGGMLLVGEWVRFVGRGTMLVEELARLHAVAQVEARAPDGNYVLTIFSARGEPALREVTLPEDQLVTCTPPMWAG
jgi:hypothetical protein